MARDETHHGGAPILLVLYQQRPAECALTPVCVVEWPAVGHRTMLRRDQNQTGMDQYEFRKYPGWHNHLLLPMLAHFCLGHLQIRLGKKSTSYDGITASEPASGGLARQNLDDCGRPPTGSRAPTA